MNRAKLRSDLTILCLKIKESKFENLVFIHDPDAPGGSELYKLIQEKESDTIKGKNILIVHIEGRGAKERKVSEIQTIHEEKTPNCSQRYMLIDSVSFSGRTLELCREHLVEKYGENIVVGAAVIYSGQPQECKLLKKEYSLGRNFLKIDSINVFQILFPWGLTQATESIFSEEYKPEGIEQFIPHKSFSFLPRPWGNVLSMVENKQTTVKILYLNPREMISKHKHFIRDEIFFILDARVLLQVWDRYILLRKGDSFRIPAGTEHRFIGLDEPCRLLEISEGYHNQVDDILRIEDKYGRRERKGDV